MSRCCRPNCRPILYFVLLQLLAMYSADSLYSANKQRVGRTLSRPTEDLVVGLHNKYMNIQLTEMGRPSRPNSRQVTTPYVVAADEIEPKTRLTAKRHVIDPVSDDQANRPERLVPKTTSRARSRLLLAVNRHAISGHTRRMTRRHAISGQTRTRRHAISEHTRIRRHATSIQTRIRRHATSIQTRTRRHAISGQTRTRRHAISGQTRTRRHAISGQTMTRRHAISGQTRTRRHAISGHTGRRTRLRGSSRRSRRDVSRDISGGYVHVYNQMDDDDESSVNKRDQLTTVKSILVAIIIDYVKTIFYFLEVALHDVLSSIGN